MTKAVEMALKNALAVVVTVANWDTFGEHGNLVQAARRAEDGLRAFLADNGQCSAVIDTEVAEVIVAAVCRPISMNDCGPGDSINDVLASRIRALAVPATQRTEEGSR